jgi:hypothetical protein
MFNSSKLHTHVLSRCRLCDCEAVWNPFRRKKTLNLIDKLNEEYKFLNDHEDASCFVRTFKFGSTHQYLHARFVLPKSNPTRWWKEKHCFKGPQCFGLPIQLKPFFDLLAVPWGKELEEKEHSDHDENSTSGDI